MHVDSLIRLFEGMVAHSIDRESRLLMKHLKIEIKFVISVSLTFLSDFCRGGGDIRLNFNNVVHKLLGFSYNFLFRTKFIYFSKIFPRFLRFPLNFSKFFNFSISSNRFPTYSTDTTGIVVDNTKT